MKASGRLMPTKRYPVTDGARVRSAYTGTVREVDQQAGNESDTRTRRVQ